MWSISFGQLLSLVTGGLVALWAKPKRLTIKQRDRYAGMTMSFTKKPALQPSQQRLKKVAAKRAVIAKTQRVKFIITVASTKETPETRARTGQMVKKIRDARAASFVNQYRRVTA